MIVMTIIGSLSALAATSWLSFLNTWRLNMAQDQVYQVMILARSTAKQEHRRWQASFRNPQTELEWAVHPVGADMDSLGWQPLPGLVQIDPDETTLYRSSDNIYRVQFDHNGNANGRLGRLTLAGINPHKTRRCVFVSTLIGTLRKARDRSTPRNGRYCY
ncbi:MAG: type II secretion system protein [Cyanothece sp. SIO2G6]|nr:type II secretion system protein [Cyanothece sp. SIO2G6]